MTLSFLFLFLMDGKAFSALSTGITIGVLLKLSTSTMFAVDTQKLCDKFRARLRSIKPDSPAMAGVAFLSTGQLDPASVRACTITFCRDMPDEAFHLLFAPLAAPFEHGPDMDALTMAATTFWGVEDVAPATLLNLARDGILAMGAVVPSLPSTPLQPDAFLLLFMDIVADVLFPGKHQLEKVELLVRESERGPPTSGPAQQASPIPRPTAGKKVDNVNPPSVMPAGRLPEVEMEAADDFDSDKYKNVGVRKSKKGSEGSIAAQTELSEQKAAIEAMHADRSRKVMAPNSTRSSLKKAKAGKAGASDDEEEEESESSDEDDEEGDGESETNHPHPTDSVPLTSPPTDEAVVAEVERATMLRAVQGVFPVKEPTLLSERLKMSQFVTRIDMTNGLTLLSADLSMSAVGHGRNRAVSTMHKKALKLTITPIFGPETQAMLGPQYMVRSSHDLWPQSPAQIEAFFTSQIRLLSQARSTRARRKQREYLDEFRSLFQEKVESMLEIHAAQHVICAAVLLFFLISTWNRALSNDRWDLLTDNFEERWVAHFVKLIPVTGQLSGSNVTISTAMCFLGFRCPTCHALGFRLHLCFHCPTQLQGVGASSTGDSAAVTAWNVKSAALFQLWKTNNPAQVPKKKSFEAFLAQVKPSELGPKPVATTRAKFSSEEEFYVWLGNHQSLVILPPRRESA